MNQEQGRGAASFARRLPRPEEEPVRLEVWPMSIDEPAHPQGFRQAERLAGRRQRRRHEQLAIVFHRDEAPVEGGVEVRRQEEAVGPDRPASPSLAQNLR